MTTDNRRKRQMPAIVDWLRSKYGQGKEFRSAAKLSLAAGRNRNQVSSIEDSQNATMEVLVDIARAAGSNPLKILVLAGYLNSDEIGDVQPERLTPEEESVVSTYRAIPDRDRPLMRKLLETSASYAVGSVSEAA